MKLAFEGVNYDLQIEGIRIADLFRKVYAVETSTDGVLWDEEGRHDNSTDAGIHGGTLRGEYAHVRVVIVEITSKPKKAFWDLWRKKAGKAALKAAGLHVFKQGSDFVVTTQKVSKTDVLRSKGYGHSYDYQPAEFDKHAMIDRDAERYGW